MDTQRIDEVLELFQPDAARLKLARSRRTRASRAAMAMAR